MYLTQGLRRAAQIRPREESTVFRGRRRIWSETADRVARIAGGLEEAGVRPGDRVAILALNSDRYFELLYAIPWLGAVMVPVNTRLATPEIRYVLEDSGARVCSSTARCRRMPLRWPDRRRPSRRCSTLTTTRRRRARGLTRSSRRDRQSQMRAPVVTRWPACSTPAARRGSPRA